MFKPQRPAPSFRLRGPSGSTMVDHRQLLDHRDTDRWIDAPTPRANVWF
jgi:hypothetical protein